MFDIRTKVWYYSDVFKKEGEIIMKILSGDIKKNIKDAIKICKSNIIFALCMVTVMNAASIYAAITNKKESNASDEGLYVVASDDNFFEDEINEVKLDVVDSKKSVIIPVTSINYVYKAMSMNSMANNFSISDEAIESIAKKVKNYYYLSDKKASKQKLLESIIEEAIRVPASNDSYIDYYAPNKMSNEENLVVSDLFQDEEITIDNFDTASTEKKMEFICDKYNLSDFELKVIISVVYHEAGWNYDDAFKVATIIYNRTKSKECIRYIHNLTKLDGESLYAQVIATSYSEDGTKVQQFDGYLPNQGEDYERPVFPLVPCFSKIYFWGDGIRNHFSGSIDSGDVVDDYIFPDEEYDYEFTREDVINMAKEYVISTKKRVK